MEETENNRLAKYYAVYGKHLPMFQSYLLPPSSG